MERTMGYKHEVEWNEDRLFGKIHHMVCANQILINLQIQVSDFNCTVIIQY